MENYQKLIDVGAIWNVDQPKRTDTTDWYSLEMPDSKRTDREVVILIDTVFRAMVEKSIEIPLPDKVAIALGKSCITVDEYLESLRNSGFDVTGLLASANDNERSLNESIASRKTKAAAFFELIKTQWIVDDDDVRKYIDGDSIYELLEIVLEHADSTRARLKAIKMHAKNPKQADKVLVRTYWDDWKGKQPDRYKSKAAFAHDMCDKFPNLKSQPVIERWCRQWARET